jgi:hypothetical protein
VLPDRFDSQGRPFSSRDRYLEHHGRRGLDQRIHARHGDFEYRPQRPGDWALRGGWRVAGTDQELVERFSRRVTDVLDGRGGGWLGLLGDVVSGLRQAVSDEDSEVSDSRRERRRRRREPERLRFRDLLLRET